MKLSEFTHTPWESESGLTWVYRQAGVALGNEIRAKLSASVPADAIRRMTFKTEADADKPMSEMGFDIKAIIDVQAEVGLLAFRVCATEVKGLEGDDGKPVDLAAHRTDRVTVGGVPVAALTLDFLAQIDSGVIGDDIRALGEKIVSEAKMGAAQKKT